MEKENIILIGFVNNMENETFAHYKQMFHFLQCFKVHFGGIKWCIYAGMCECIGHS